MPAPPFETAIAELVWDTRYRYRRDGVVRDRDPAATWRRVARALAAGEPDRRRDWERRFFDELAERRFLPGGRILAGAGTGFDVTLFNCFVMGTIEDSMEGIFDALKEGALTMQMGGGVGYDFSTLRPAGTPAWRVGGTASGPVSFMHIWNATCETLLATAARRGAMMGTLRCDHPDILAFVDAKRQPGQLHNFNLSVLVSDDFMQAVSADAEWPLVFPAAGLGAAASRGDRRVLRAWSGSSEPVPCAVMDVIPARALWQRIMRANYDSAEPGVLFIDRINAQDNLGYRERISATNPCGEVPLPPYGACNLGSINLTRFVRAPFTRTAGLDLPGIARTAAVAVRMLDNVIDLSRFPLPQQAAQALGSRRIGLGVTGLADSLILLGLHYASDAARTLAAEVMRTVCHAAYRASIDLAEDRGPFPFCDRGALRQRPFVRALPADIRDGIAAKGLRNSHLTAIAPTGTVSLLADNVSSGIEPVFAFEHRRRVRSADGTVTWHELTDLALRRWRERDDSEPLPAAFVEARALAPGDHLAMQAAVQPYVDNAISKTINVPADVDFDAFCAIYAQAYRSGLKGCTTYRPNAVTGAVLQPRPGPSVDAAECCDLPLPASGPGYTAD